MLKTKRTFCIFFLLLFPLVFAFSLELNIRVNPVAAIPVQQDADNPLFSVGGGAFINADVELFDFLSLGPEFGYYLTPLYKTSTFAQLSAGGLGASVYFYPLARLALRLGGSGGIYEIAYGENTGSQLWWKGYGEVGFRISPLFTLSAGAGYIRFAGGAQEPMYTGIIAGITGRFSLDTVAAGGHISARLEQPEPVFPLLYGIYKQNSVGTLTITNDESAEIRNVSISFRAENYTDSLFPCGSADIIRKDRSLTLPLYADFSETLQNFTESGKIPGEVVINYSLLGEEREVRKTVIVSVHNRNTLRWSDPAVIAAFVSPNSPEVLDFSKYVVGIARNMLRSGLNRNMQFALYMFEGLRIGGISYSNDDSTPYTVFSRDPSLLDYVQYPFQTLSFRMGDYDDLGLLYAAALESVGIKSALIPLADDFIVLYSLEIGPEEAENLFDRTDNLLTIGDEIWMPLSVSVLREGFVNAWYRAMDNINAAITAGENLDLIILQDAWRTYPPSGIKGGQQAGFEKPAEVSLNRAAENALLRYITTEFGPKIRAVQNDIRTQGGSAQLYNRLGLLYVRAGMYREAKAEYRRAAELNSTAAMINLGNIAVLEKDYQTAAVWFSAALERQPDNRTALNALERIQSELPQ